MTPTPFVQRNPYKGSLSRAWIRLRFSEPSGALWEGEFLADTGCAHEVVVGLSVLARLRRRAAMNVNTNFGWLVGAWLELSMPELGLVCPLVGFGNDRIVAGARASSPDFEGLVGLPFLRLIEYGGDANWFWIRPAGGTP